MPSSFYQLYRILYSVDTHTTKISFKKHSLFSSIQQNSSLCWIILSLPLLFWITFIFWIVIFIFWVLHVHMFCLCILDFLEPAVSEIFWPLLIASSQGTSTFSNADVATALLLTKSPHADPSLKGSTNSQWIPVVNTLNHSSVLRKMKAIKRVWEKWYKWRQVNLEDSKVHTTLTQKTSRLWWLDPGGSMNRDWKGYQIFFFSLHLLG